MRCPACSARFCLACPCVDGGVGPAHPGQSCAEYADQLRASEEAQRQLAAWRERIEELVERSGPIEPPSKHALLGIGVSEWDFGLTERVGGAITETTDAFERLDTSARAWLDKLGTAEHADHVAGDDLSKLVEIASLLINSPRPARAMLVGRDAPALRERLRKAIEIGRERDTAREALGKVYQPEFLSIEHLPHLDAAKRAADQISLIRYFRARSVRGKLRVYARDKVPALPQLMTDLEKAIQARRLHDELAAMNDIAQALGAQWNNASPDWGRLEAMLRWCDTFAEQIAALAHQPELAKRIIEAACNETVSIDAECKALIESHRVWQDTWQTTSETLSTNDTRAFGEDTSGWLSRVRGVLERWPTGLDDLNNWCVYNAARDAAVYAGLTDLVAMHESGELTRDTLSPAFEAIMWIPRTLSLSLSTINLTRPSASAFALARLFAMNGNLPVLYLMPASFSCCSVLPTQAISGLV